MFGRYRIDRELGRGAMAVVYLAEDTALQRNVALKSLSAQYATDVGFRERFQREGRILARVHHESIVPIFDFGEEDNVPYIVMEYMSGGTLADRIDRNQLSVEESLDVLRRVARGLDAAHAAGVIHRDLKPANILFDQRGRAFVGDFGVGRMDGASTGVTMPGTVIGTAQYMSPEQVNGAPPTAAADIYSFGALAYETLVGHAPFRGDNVWAIMRQHLEDPVPPPGTINPAMAFADEPLLAALSKTPEGRPAQATDVSEALDRGYERWRPAAASAPFARVDDAEDPETTVVTAPSRTEPSPGPEPNASLAGAPVRGKGRRWNRTAILAAMGAAFVAAGIAVGIALLLGGGDDDDATPADESSTPEGSATATGEATSTGTSEASPSATVETRDVSGDIVIRESFDDPSTSTIQPPASLSGSGFFDSGRLIAQDLSADDDRYAPIVISTGATTHAIAIDAFAPGGILIFTCRGNERFEVRLRVRQDSQEFQTQVLDKQQPSLVTLTDWTKSTAIKADGPNRFAMICHGSEAVTVANRKVLATDRIPGIEGGQVSFGVDGGVQAAFDNVEIRTN